MSSRSMRRARQRKTLRDQRRRALMTGAAGAVLFTPAVARADTFVVNSGADSGVGTLRAAVGSANANPGADTITFDPIVYPGTIQLTSGEIAITANEDLTIEGPGRDKLSVSGDANGDGAANSGDSRIFDVSASSGTAQVAISGLTLTGGYAAAGNQGGAVRSSAADLTLTDAAVTDSTSGFDGGGISANGDLTLTRSLLTGNTSTSGAGGGAAVNKQTAVDGGTVSGNTAASGGGGIVAHAGSLAVADATFTDNHVTSGPGGGLLVNSAGLQVTRSTISNNTAASGAGVSAYTSKYQSGIFQSTVTGNTATDAGGGISLSTFFYGAKVSGTTVSNNKAPLGAGVELYSGLRFGGTTIERSTIQGNTGTGASSAGGGLAIVQAASPVRLLDSTVTGNTASRGGGVIVGGSNDPVFKYGSDGKQSGSVDLDDSTISGNTGGGVTLGSYDSYSTPATRKAAAIGMTSTIVSGNTGGDTNRDADATSGGISAAFSLIQSPGDAPLTSTAVITGKDPQLGGLADNGGPTQTLLPSGTSPAIDSGRSGSKNDTDQRGLARVVDSGLANPAGGDGTDIGAVELAASAVVVPVASATPSPGASATPAPGFAVAAGSTPITSGRPLLPASLTPLTCAVTIVKLTGCDVAIRSTGPIKLSKKQTVPAGTLLAEAQPTSAEGAATLSAKAVLSADGRAVLKKRPVGVDARAVGVGSYSGSMALTQAGSVHLLAGPTVTLKIKKGTKLSKTVKTQLGQLGTLITGAKTVSVRAYGPSKSKAAKVATAAAGALTDAGVKATPAASGKKAKSRRLKVTFTL